MANLTANQYRGLREGTTSLRESEPRVIFRWSMGASQKSPSKLNFYNVHEEPFYISSYWSFLPTNHNQLSSFGTGGILRGQRTFNYHQRCCPYQQNNYCINALAQPKELIHLKQFSERRQPNFCLVSTGEYSAN